MGLLGGFDFMVLPPRELGVNIFGDTCTFKLHVEFLLLTVGKAWKH